MVCGTTVSMTLRSQNQKLEPGQPTRGIKVESEGIDMTVMVPKASKRIARMELFMMRFECVWSWIYRPAVGLLVLFDWMGRHQVVLSFLWTFFHFFYTFLSLCTSSLDSAMDSHRFTLRGSGVPDVRKVVK